MVIEFETQKVKVKDIKLDGDNPNVMDKKMQNRLKGSFEGFGNTQDVVIDSKTMVLADGEHRLKEYINQGIEEIPAKLVPFESDAHRRAYRQAANKIHGEHDPLKDVEEFQKIMNEVDKDLLKIITGMDYTEVQEHLRKINGIEDEEAFDVDAAIEDIKEPITKKGDVILLGKHRLMCGDSIKSEDVGILMQEDKADLLFTDPPYNVNYGNHNNPKYKSTKDNAIVNDNLKDEEWTIFQLNWLERIKENVSGAVYICMSTKSLPQLRQDFIKTGFHWSSDIIWVKDRFVIGMKDYNSRYETIMYGWIEGEKHYWCKDSSKDDIWEIKRNHINDLHPTMKPVELCAMAIVNSSKKEGSVLDLFGGSGSTLIACEQTNRKCLMMEIDPIYCDVIIQRWETLTEEKAQRL